MLKILALYSSVVIEKYLHNFEIACERDNFLNILKFCNEVCGERSHQYLVTTIEDNLPQCLDFENICALNYEAGKLFSLKRVKSDTSEILIQGLTELPTAVGITGKALAERTIITSAYGKNDVNYNEQTDNVMKLKHLENIIVIPLLVDHNKGRIIAKDNSKELELVGVLQLINGDLSKLNSVIVIMR